MSFGIITELIEVRCDIAGCEGVGASVVLVGENPKSGLLQGMADA